MPRTNEEAKSLHEKILAMIEGIVVMPTTASIPLRILELQRVPTANNAHYAEALKADPSLCTRLLAFANSAWFHPTKPITRVSDAIAMIGLKKTVSLVLATALSGIQDSLNLSPKVKQSFWEIAILKGVAARECSRHLRSEYVEEAFVCGMIQDIALPILYAAAPSRWLTGRELIESESQGQRGRGREALLYGASHAELGKMLLQHIGLPTLYSVATETHHDGADLRCATAEDALAKSLEFAAMLPHTANERIWAGAKFERFFDKKGYGDQLDISPSSLFVDVERRYEEMQRVLSRGGTTDSAIQQCLHQAGQEVAMAMELLIGESYGTRATAHPAAQPPEATPPESE